MHKALIFDARSCVRKNVTTTGYTTNEDPKLDNVTCMMKFCLFSYHWSIALKYTHYTAHESPNGV